MGGSVSGSGSTVYIAPNGCGSTITGTVRSQSACGLNSAPRSFSITAPSSKPSKPTITGPPSISSGGVSTFYSSGNNLPTEWEWEVNYTPGTLTWTPSSSNFIVMENQVTNGQTYLPYLRVKVKNRCGWSSWSNTKQFSITGTGGGAPMARMDLGGEIADKSDEVLIVYPNATSDLLNFSKSPLQLMEEGYEEILLVDNSGKEVFSESISNLEGSAIDISSVKAGNYILLISGNSLDSFQSRIIKQ